MLISIESFVKGAFPTKALAEGQFLIFGFTDENFPTPRSLPLDAVDWFSVANGWRKTRGFDRMAIGGEVSFKHRKVFLPLCAFLPGIAGIGPDNRRNRHADNFWVAVSEAYPRKRFVVFAQGTRHVGFLETTLEGAQERDNWLNLLEDHPRVVDPRWLDVAFRHGIGGAIGVIGDHTPRLVRWVRS